MTQIKHELTEVEYRQLWTRGYHAVLDYGWMKVLGLPRVEDYEEWYKGSFLKEEDGRFYIIVKTDKDNEEDDLK